MYLSTNLIIRILILSCFLFCLISCGQNGVVSVSPVNTVNTEYEEFLANSKIMSPDLFCQWWNQEEYKSWTFYYYRDQNNPDSPIVWPDTDSSEKIYTSHIINCHRITKLLLTIYSDVYKDTCWYVYLEQLSINYDHVVMLYSTSPGIYRYVTIQNGTELKDKLLEAHTYNEAIDELKSIYHKD